MNKNQGKLVRFLSEQYQNHGYINEDGNSTNNFVVEAVKIPKKNFLRQISIEAENKIDQSEREVQRVNDILQQPTLTCLTSIDLNKKIDQHTNIIVESVSPHVAIETGITHREQKSGSQRLRWNLLFNLLFWLIVPLPFWIPFVSNKVALYLLPSIQGVFVFIWIGK